MKVLFITAGKNPIPTINGGAVETLIELLIEDNEKKGKHEYEVYSIYDEKMKMDSIKYKNTKIYFIKIISIIDKLGRGFRHILNKVPNIYVGNEYISKVKKKIKKSKKKYDVIIIENVPEYVLPLKKSIKSKYILHLHNDFLNNQTKLSKKILDSYDYVFSISKYIKSRVATIEDSKKIKVLYNGIDIDKFAIKKDPIKMREIKEKYNIQNDEKIVLYTGRIVEEKGVKELVEAFTRVKDDRLKLIIAGSYKYGSNKENSYLKEIKKIALKRKKNIIFTGYIQYSDLPYIYQMAEFGIIPSIWGEPFALTVIEHLASGHPIIVTNVGAIPEIVDSNVAKIIKKDDNIVENLKNEIENFSKISLDKIYNRDQLIKYSRKFSKEEYVKKFDELIQEVIYEIKN